MGGNFRGHGRGGGHDSKHAGTRNCLRRGGVNSRVFCGDISRFDFLRFAVKKCVFTQKRLYHKGLNFGEIVKSAYAP